MTDLADQQIDVLYNKKQSHLKSNLDKSNNFTIYFGSQKGIQPYTVKLQTMIVYQYI